VDNEKSGGSGKTTEAVRRAIKDSKKSIASLANRYDLNPEMVHKCEFKTIKEVSSAIFEYIEVFYNRIRAHSTNGYYSPAQYKLKATNCM
jgi:transposase InsO family protein